MVAHVNVACRKDHLVAYLVRLFMLGPVYISFIPILSNGETGLSFLLGYLPVVHYYLHNFNMAQHTPAGHKTGWYKGVVA